MSKAEIKIQEKPSSLTKSHDKKKRELVVGRVAFEDQVTEIDGDAGAQSSHDMRRAPRPKMKW